MDTMLMADTSNVTAPGQMAQPTGMPIDAVQHCARWGLSLHKEMWHFARAVQCRHCTICHIN